jgi:hypothetical protein
MARKKDPQLRKAIRGVYSDLRISGPPTIHDIVEAVSSRYPKLVAKEKERLFSETIASWTRKILNSDSDSLRSTQLILPMELASASLPVCMPVRQTTGDTILKETPDASFNDVDAAIAFIEKHIRESRRLSSLKALREYLASRIPEKRRNDPIGPILAKLAKEQIAAQKKA